MINLKRLEELYQEGVNITSYLREECGAEYNDDHIVEVAYDLQAGSYVELMSCCDVLDYKEEYTKKISAVISGLCNANSILEAGVGEATTLSGVIKNLNKSAFFYGFDISWSRLAYARRWLMSEGVSSEKFKLCTGELTNIPFCDNSIDIVYTSHSIEPNHGKEEEILKELYRVARKYVILLEPGYEFASNEAKERMEHFGYCRGLKEKANALGYKVISHEVFIKPLQPLNPTAITIIEKNSDSFKTITKDNVFLCPKYKTTLETLDDVFFSPDGLILYPVIGGIPCLRVGNGIIASKYKQFI